MVSDQHIWRFRGIAVSASALGGVSLWDNSRYLYVGTVQG